MIVHFIKKVVLLIVIIMFYGTSIFSQSVTQKFYKDSYLYKEVEESKAKFVKTITENQDESMTYEVKEIKTNKFIKRYSYKGFEPVGLWVFENEKLNVDYNFNVEYIDTFICSDCYKDTLIKDYFENNDTFNYKAPVLNNGDKSILKYFSNKVNYPVYAIENAIEGKLLVSFIINEKGIVNDVKVIKGAHIVLDKELVMVIKSLRFSSPCLINNKPIKLGFKLPFTFRLD
jgi:TonB family protein